MVIWTQLLSFPFFKINLLGVFFALMLSLSLHIMKKKFELVIIEKKEDEHGTKQEQKIYLHFRDMDWHMVGR